MARKERLIWSSTFNVDEWDFDTEESLSEEEKYDLAQEENNMYLDDERANLNIQLDNPILVIASLGLWNGRRSAYKIIQSGNIKDILYYDYDDVKWYSDGYNIKGIEHHHDGTNYYEYRLIKNMNNIEKLYNKLAYNEEVTREMIRQYTTSILPYVAKAYGW